MKWARALTDQAAFKTEQQRLGQLWTFLGLAEHLQRDGDWFRAMLGGRSVFVQRFGGDIKGFENRCAHRFYPLRTEDRGNGPVVCGFHHWRYNHEGRAVGIPMCQEMFGVTPSELNARLNPVEIALCGSLVFGRFPGELATETLEQFLGEAWPIINALGAIAGEPQSVKDEAAANWKLLFQITLDDYHTPAIHGRERYQRNVDLHYFRFGRHSAHFYLDADTLDSMAAACREGRYRPSSYRIFNIFPNLAISLFKADPYWYAHLQQFVPHAPDRTTVRGWFYRTQFPPDETTKHFFWKTRPFTRAFRNRIVRRHVEKIADEDHRACEKLQSVAHQIDRWPLLAWQEERIAWFEEAYAEALAGPVTETQAK
jgi:phenylpropionate dioxygenase-like ring-hydroxylating dioxygenase large terminal subunit